MVPYRDLDMRTYPRQTHFAHFRSLPWPLIGVTVMMDVTRVKAYCQDRHASFYLVMMHIVCLAANQVPALRQRIREDGIREFEFCHTSHIELLEDGTYTYCTLYHDRPMEAYLTESAKIREACRKGNGLTEDPDVDSYLFISTLPWLHYTQLIQPGSGGSNPQITWGKAERNAEGRYMMPLTLQAHHALVDGIHLAAFFENVTEEIGKL